jgi:hypothetical protein
MFAEQMSTQQASWKTITRWSAYLEELHARIAHRFQRPEVRARANRYLAGLLGEVRRKNSWQMAEAIGEARPRGVQHPSTTLTGMQMPSAMTCASMSSSISAMNRAAS